MTDDKLNDAIAVLRKQKPIDEPWDARNFPPVNKTAHAIATVLNAAASGALIPKEAAEAQAGALLDQAAKKAFNAIAKYPLRTMVTNTDNATMLELAILAIAPDATAALERALVKAREVTPEQSEMLAKEMQAIVAADRWKGRDLAAAPPEKWSHLRPETRQFWIDTATRILAALKQMGGGE